MNKMNKKGFTLIEMLVVIAIIAVLVAIIIPVVGNSTQKAAAATNAANLRALKAEAVTAALTQTAETTNLKLTYTNGALTAVEVKTTAPTSKAVTGLCDAGVSAVLAVQTNGDILATYDSDNIAAFAAKAS